MRIAVFMLALSALALASTLNITAKVNALVPTKNSWLAITSEGLIVLPQPTNLTVIRAVVKTLCNTPYVSLYVPTNAPGSCVVEALTLLSQPKRVVAWNASLASNFTCRARYLFSELVSSITNGTNVVVVYPLENTICKRVSVDSRIVNNTLVVDIKIKKLKPWLDICPSSKLIDVVVAWGKAEKVRVLVNGNVELEERSPRAPSSRHG